jgi:hypothetical protein
MINAVIVMDTNDAVTKVIATNPGEKNTNAAKEMNTIHTKNQRKIVTIEMKGNTNMTSPQQHKPQIYTL